MLHVTHHTVSRRMIIKKRRTDWLSPRISMASLPQENAVPQTGPNPPAPSTPATGRNLRPRTKIISYKATYGAIAPKFDKLTPSSQATKGAKKTKKTSKTHSAIDIYSNTSNTTATINFLKFTVSGNRIVDGSVRCIGYYWLPSDLIFIYCSGAVAAEMVGLLKCV